MSAGDEVTAARTGSGADLARRMDRLEEKYDDISKEVSELTGKVTVIATTQAHQDELAKERHGNLEGRLTLVSAQLSGFMARIEGLLTGEVQLPQQRDLMRDWVGWRTDVDKTLDSQAVMNGQVRLLGRLAWGLLGCNLLAIAAAVYALIKP